ncbi:DNA/RNA-binding protein KIN17 [Taenia crassiceps]|uniref:DNA/RNA-binding protein KIN17 n=1 Tax=Taenia crassiceps TaxID=6207 RepID=A0ABR4QNN6_9CEST
MSSVIHDDLQCSTIPSSNDCSSCPSAMSVRRRDEKKCAVCGDHAVGFNFGAIACESCKAFFRRNALRATMPPCLFNGNCLIQVKTRRFCSPCRLSKCFAVGMRKSCIMDEKAKRERREKIQRNRERKVASGQIANSGSTRGGAIAHSNSPQRCYQGDPSPNPDYHSHSLTSDPSAPTQHQHHPQQTLPSYYPLISASHSATVTEALPSTSCHNTIDEESGMQSTWQMPQNLQEDRLPAVEGPIDAYPSHHHLHQSHLMAPPSSSCLHPQSSFGGLESYSHPTQPLPEAQGTLDVTPNEAWLQLMTSSKTVEENSTTLPYFVKKPPKATLTTSAKCQPSNVNGNSKSGVKNVLDGHVWTLEPEDPSNKECIALCPSFLKSGMARLLSKHQWTALNDLRSAYETSFLDSASDHAPESSSNITISSLVNTSGFLVRKFINFAKKLADFSVLGQEGQICLLKGVVLNALFIRSASHYDVVKDVWLTPKGEIPTSILKIATGMQNLYEEHAKYCRNFADVVKRDSHLVALMQVLCLFAPDRPRLSDRQSVSNIYDRYILLLKHYLEARHGFTRGRTLLAAVLTNLAELQALTDNYGHILLHVDPSKVDPLILEVFNLSDRGKANKDGADEGGASSPLTIVDGNTVSWSLSVAHYSRIMGKEKPGFLTPKAISNRIKSKGLQKLRWYCQMCQKQCRDENGYKCHTNSESHHRQMKIFMENGGKFISGFSSEFLKGYLDIVRRQFGGKRVHANVVYQEYIKDKEHIHMNATRWHSLTGLCLWLGKQGICRVDETEKGWYIEYIDQDPEAESRRASDARLTKTEDEINRQLLAKQIEKAAASKSIADEKNFKAVKPLIREDDNTPIKLDLQFSSTKNKADLQVGATYAQSNTPEKPEKVDQVGEPTSSDQVSPKASDRVASPKIYAMEKSETTGKVQKIVNPLLLAEKKAQKSKALSDTEKLHHSSAAGVKRSNLDELMAEEEMQKEKRNRKDYWMTVGIEVKLTYYKLPKDLLYRHAAIIDMEDDYTALVRVLNSSKTKLKVDQDHVETVIPPIGDPVLVVNGAYRGEVAILKQVDKERFRVDIVIESGLCRGRIVRDVSMEDVCKVCDISTN